jgi:tetratricopeptide (TPR) repeat protein
MFTLTLLCLTVLLSFIQLSPPAFAAASPRQMTPPKAVIKPVELGTERQALNLTDDIPTAETQAAAHPTDPEAQFLLAVAYSRSPYIEKALQVLQRTKRLIKNRQDRLATVDHLIREYEQALTARPTDTRILYRLAFGYYLKGMGLKKYQNVPATEQLAWIHQAETTMQKVIALDASDIWARNYLGFVLAEEGTDTARPELVKQAEHIWNESLVINPVNPGAYWLLAQLYIKQGNLLKAAQFAEKGIVARQQIEQAPKTGA